MGSHICKQLHTDLPEKYTYLWGQMQFSHTLNPPNCTYICVWYLSIISASIHRYVNYFDIQVLMMLTETETLTSTLHHDIFTYLYFVYIFIFQVEELILWIGLPRPENPVNTYARHTGTLDSCFDLIRSHQQCIFGLCFFLLPSHRYV